MARISVEEWRKQKEAGNTQGTSQSPAASNTSKSSSTSVESSSKSSSKSSGRISVAEWRAQKATGSIQDWVAAATSILNDTNQYLSKWHSKDDEAYASI